MQRTYPAESQRHSGCIQRAWSGSATVIANLHYQSDLIYLWSVELPRHDRGRDPFPPDWEWLREAPSTDRSDETYFVCCASSLTLLWQHRESSPLLPTSGGIVISVLVGQRACLLNTFISCLSGTQQCKSIYLRHGITRHAAMAQLSARQVRQFLTFPSAPFAVRRP